VKTSYSSGICSESFEVGASVNVVAAQAAVTVVVVVAVLVAFAIFAMLQLATVV
jgi:hypothetical protein